MSTDAEKRMTEEHGICWSCRKPLLRVLHVHPDGQDTIIVVQYTYCCGYSRNVRYTRTA